MNAEYLQWRSQFVRKRLQIVTAIAAVCIFSFMMFALMGNKGDMPLKADISLTLDLMIEMVLIAVFVVLRSRFANNYVYPIFFIVPTLITLTMQINASSAGIVASLMEKVS